MTFAALKSLLVSHHSGRIKVVHGHQNLPNINRLSVLISTILLAYAVTPLVNISEREIGIQLFGISFTYDVDLSLPVSLLVAVMAAVGTDWLLREHPNLENQSTVQHWMIPALTTLVIAIPLNTLKIGLEWWAVFAFGGMLLVSVLLAEYIVVDLSNELHAPATVGLTSVSFALYLVMAIAVRAADLRLYIMLPTVFAICFLVVLRTLYLRLGGKWRPGWAVGCALLVSQLAMGLHYLPASPVSFGLALLGAAYALTAFITAVEEQRPANRIWIEPAVMLVIFWAMALILR